MRSRDPKDIVLEAELLASPPDRVRAWLMEIAKEKASIIFSRDDCIERALLKRGDALITLSLARYSASFEVARAILAGPARDDKVLRLALLMNETVGRASIGHMPSVLLGDQPIDRFLAELDEEEITALFSNRELDDNFLISFFEQKAPWQALDHERRLVAIRTLQSNPRMQAAYDGPYDGYAEYMHNKVFDAAWELADKLPVTAEWAGYLRWLYEKLIPQAHSIEKPLELAARWIPDPTDAKQIEQEKQDLERGTLGVFAGMRKSIARLAVAGLHSQEERRAFANHEDPAVRAAFYAGTALTLEEMRAADARDPLLSFEEMMWNSSVWSTKVHRKLLHDMAWDSKRDPKSYMDPQNTFEARLEYYRNTYPEWFKDEGEVAEASEPEAQTGASDGIGNAVEGMQGELFTNNELARATHVAVLKGLKRIAWLGWGIAAVLALLLLRAH